jgi:hypothetical protein
VQVISAVLCSRGALGKGTLCRYPPSRVPTPLLSLSPASLIPVAITHIVAIALIAVAYPPPLLPSSSLLLPLPSSLHPSLSVLPTTLIHHCSCRPCPLCCCPHHPPHALVICRRPPSWSCGHQCSIASHCPPLMLTLLVDFCFSPLPQTGGGLGPSFALLFSGLVLVQHCQGCGVATAVTAIPVLASGQFWPSPLPGACTTEATCRRGGRAGMPLFDLISIVSTMVLEYFVCDESKRLGLCRVHVKYGTNV